MSWVVVTQQAYEAWAATTDDVADADLRIAVLEWALALQTTGPPPDGIFDAARSTHFAAVGDTGVWAEYIALPHLDPPAIVIRAYS